MTVKQLIERLEAIENKDSIVVIQDGKYNDMQVADLEYVEENCGECKTIHKIVYLKNHTIRPAHV